METAILVLAVIHYCGLGNLSFEKTFTINVNDMVESGMINKYNQNLTIYPNPFKEAAIIEFNNPKGNSYTLYLTDISGKVCRIVDNITTSRYVLEREALKEGFYFIELRGPKIYRGKIVIE